MWEPPISVYTTIGVAGVETANIGDGDKFVSAVITFDDKASAVSALSLMDATSYLIL